jgi:hypothetical protein
MVTRIDRLACSVGDLQDIVLTIKARGASLTAAARYCQTHGGTNGLTVLPVYYREIRLSGAKASSSPSGKSGRS